MRSTCINSGRVGINSPNPNSTLHFIISHTQTHSAFPNSKFRMYHHLFCFLCVLLFAAGRVQATTFTIVNKCDSTVWPGILSNAGSDPMEPTGFVLPAGHSQTVKASTGWAGRLWARTGCTFDSSNGKGNCTTGDCGSNQIECCGAGVIPPATLVEFKLDGADGKDFYDVSLVDGYNMPVLVEAKGGTGTCAATGCAADLNRRCPSELRSGDSGGCQSACEAFGKPEYCCSGEFANPNTCRPSVYSEMFKSACPRSYSYAYDDATSTFTCAGADYTVTFCPERVSSPSPHKKGVSIQADSWLANLAIGDATPRMMITIAQFPQQASLMVIALAFSNLLLCM